MRQVTLDTPLSAVLGGSTARVLARAFEMGTVSDLLVHLPRRYSRRGDLTPLTGLPVGEQVTVVAQVLDVRERSMQRRRGSILEARITDGAGSLLLTFFNQTWRLSDLSPGRRGIFAGKVSEYNGKLQLQHPEYELFDDPVDAPGARQLDEAAAKAWAAKPVPIYPATAQVASWTIQRCVEFVLDGLGAVSDPLPEHIREAEGILTLGRAFELAHRPECEADWEAAQASLRFREAFELQIALLDRRRRSALSQSTPRPVQDDGLLARFDAALPFRLTGDQQEAGETISSEISASHPMHRLLQGEVGSGKTLVALRAMLQVAETGGQSALLAPTEVLAGQHFLSITEVLGPDLAAELMPVLLTGCMSGSERKRALLALASGTARIAVGTHALLGEGVSFYDLGLVVVDEQHRFGVEQRETLRRKGKQPHVLAMTATPIPRTVALTAFGDLEISSIRELPPGRKGIDTFVVPEVEMPRRAARVWERAAEDIARGRQVYVVCPAIAPNEQGGELEEGAVLSGGGGGGSEGSAGELANVEQTLAWLSSMPAFFGFRVEALTGAMPAAEKERVMSDFHAGNVHILVATTVVEVGVNVPNASMMIVRDADRFGISQLHQLRGRVGRGEHAGLCLLLTSAERGSVARERVEAVAAIRDGFALAEVDLQLRREGNILGTEQSGGRSSLRVLRVAVHGEIIERARMRAAALLSRDPDLVTAPGLAALLSREDSVTRLDNLAKY